MSAPAGDIWKVVIVYRVRFQNRNALTVLRQNRRAHKSEYDQGKQPAAQLCLPDMSAPKRPLLAQEPVDMWALSKFFAGVKSGLRRQTLKIIVAVD